MISTDAMLWFISTLGGVSRREAAMAYSSIASQSLDAELASWDFDCELFEMLGHVEIITGNENELKVNPIHLARLSSTSVCLCGFRCPEMEVLLQDIGFVSEVQPRLPSVLPSRKVFTGSALDIDIACSQISTATGRRIHLSPLDREDTASWQLANFGRSYNDVLEGLTWQKVDRFSTPEFFDPLTRRRTSSVPDLKRFCYVLSFEAGGYGPQISYLWKLESGSLWRARIDRKWGRYLAMRTLEEGFVNTIIWFDKTQLALASPGFMPLPWPFGRALTISAGFVPTICNVARDSDSQYVAFRDVPQALASLIASKLGQIEPGESKITEGVLN